MNKNVKIVFVFIFTVIFIVPSSICAIDQIDTSKVSVILDNEFISYNENYGKPYIDKNNRTMVPLRLTLETFGAEVKWEGKINTAVLTYEDTVVKVTVGKKYIYKNGEKIINDTYAVNKNNRIYLPIRVVMEAFNCEVLWDGSNKIVIINSDCLPHIEDIGDVDAKFDLREEGNVTSIKDQKEIGACWAFAALGALESTILKQTGEMFDFSEDNISLGHGFNLNQNEGGNNSQALAYFARWSGPVLEKDDRYGDGKINKNLKSVKHVQEAYYIPDNDLDAIKYTVKTYGGVHSTIYLELGKDSDHKYYNTETHSLYYTGDEQVNHDVVIVGWDDNYPKENFTIQPNKNGAFICKNSYGPNFGEQGYFYVSYCDNYIGKNNMVYSKIEDNDNYDKIYQADWLGSTGSVGFDTDCAYFSNVYETNDRQEKLKAVSFYTTGKNSKYEIYLVEKFNDKYDFRNMEYQKSGFIEYKGYYTINLKKPIVLDKNSRFAVVVKLTTPGRKYPVAVELYDSTYNSEINLTDNESYVSFDGGVWENTQSMMDGNVCLKAFTDIVS